MKIKALILIVGLTLLAAGCDPFGQNLPAGIVKTANGGADWQATNKIKDSKTNMSGFSIAQLYINPTFADHIYAGTYNDGLYLSEDDGATWRPLLSRLTVYDFVVHPRDANIIYAAGFFSGHGRVLVTRDGGKSWTEIFNDAANNNPVRTIAMNPQAPDNIVIGLANGSIIGSVDAGSNWKLLQSYTDRVNRLRYTAGSLYALFRTGGLYRSADNGATFINITKPLTPSGTYFGQLLSPTLVDNFNQVSVSSNNPNLIYLATSNGLYRTFNGGVSWAQVSVPIKQPDAAVNAVAIAPSSDNVVYASVGATIYKTSDSGNTWQTENSQSGGLVNTFAIQPNLPQQAFAGIFVSQ